MARTLYDKLWDSREVCGLGDGWSLIYVDRHLLHEVSTPQAFATLDRGGYPLHRSSANLAVADHAVPTRARAPGIADPLARAQVARLERNVAAYGAPYIPLADPRQGIVHVIGPEFGFTLPGAVVVCGDSHTSTHGAFGALAFGVGASECATVMATQTLRQRRAASLRVVFDGEPGPFISAKDMALATIAALGANGGAGHAIEYAGQAVTRLSMAGRMTLCNMSIEAGARVGLVAPDETTFAYLKGRAMAPEGLMWSRAIAHWETLQSDPGARFAREVRIPMAAVAPVVTWGTSPEDAASITGAVPDPLAEADPSRRARMTRALAYMDLSPGQALEDIEIDHVFIGSCTNGRIEDLREAAEVVRGRRVAAKVSALVVPGSGAVKAQAEDEGLDRVFANAGFEWREAGCSLCVAMNDDRLAPGARCASTSNRNFEGRQGPGVRTHLMSPAMAAAAAVTGRLTDVRRLAA